MNLRLPDHVKTVTVSGLHSNIGKTLLSERLLSFMTGTAAIKMTTSDLETFITDAADKIMVPGKDTWRLKRSGAEKVVWITAAENDTLDAFNLSMALVGGYDQLLIEGNSILKYLTPDLSFFICDERVLADGRMKPSRLTALKKAKVIIYNFRNDATGADTADQVRCFCAGCNPDAEYHVMNLMSADVSAKMLHSILERYHLSVCAW